jgi:hypothetical protein
MFWFRSYIHFVIHSGRRSDRSCIDLTTGICLKSLQTQYKFLNFSGEGEPLFHCLCAPPSRAAPLDISNLTYSPGIFRLSLEICWHPWFHANCLGLQSAEAQQFAESIEIFRRRMFAEVCNLIWRLHTIISFMSFPRGPPQQRCWVSTKEVPGQTGTRTRDLRLNNLDFLCGLDLN